MVRDYAYRVGSSSTYFSLWGLVQVRSIILVTKPHRLKPVLLKPNCLVGRAFSQDIADAKARGFRVWRMFENSPADE
jgi:hypothetical protein